ncbi:hypothetical protein VTN00DRAFT_4814 [Thermoascus crustaceus]|uniref:uncharacterized protein n=1 Tax=Thermoascus crustaceus TaxID=5088 RepID=UPI003741FFEF
MSSQPQRKSVTATEIPYSQTYWERLSFLVHSVEVLKSDGYKLEPLDSEALWKMRRCRNCHLRMRTRNRQPKSKSDSDEAESRLENVSPDRQGDGDPVDADAVADEEEPVDKKKEDAAVDEPVKEDDITVTVEVPSPDETKEKKTEKEEKKKKYPCRFHPGAVVCKLYTCCANKLWQPGCTFAEHHVCEDYAPGELEAQWMLHKTPQHQNSKSKTKNKHPPPSPRKAIALDSEMGTSAHGESELIRLTAVDYFTGETLIDSLVYPSVPMRHFNTRYSGVTRGMIEAARRKRTCLMGRDAARQQLWRFVGPETIVVVHGGNNDFLALRWIHTRVVDTFLVEGVWKKREREKEEQKEKEQQQEQGEEEGRKEKEEKKKRPDGKGEGGGRSLKSLADVRLGWKIQCGRNGHDSLEDALACRALVDWYVGDLGRSVQG